MYYPTCFGLEYHIQEDSRRNKRAETQKYTLVDYVEQTCKTLHQDNSSFLSHGATALVSLGLLIVEVSRSHSYTHTR